MMLPFLPLLEHRLHARLRDEEHAGQVHVQGRVPLVERIILEAAGRDSLLHRIGIELGVERRGIHQDIEPPKLRKHRSDQCLHGAGFCNIGRKAFGLITALAQAYRQLFAPPSALISTTATDAPASASVLQNSTPSNPAPPVTTAARPFRSNLSWIFIFPFKERRCRLHHPPIFVQDISRCS